MRPVQAFPNFQTTNLSFPIFIVSVDKIMPEMICNENDLYTNVYGVTYSIKVVFNPLLLQKLSNYYQDREWKILFVPKVFPLNDHWDVSELYFR